MPVFYHRYDLSHDVTFPASVAIDTEAMGLKNHRDRLCVVQLGFGDGKIHIIHFPTPDFSNSPRLKALLLNDSIEKIFHYARFDLAILMHSFNIFIHNVYCTKVASKLTRTYTDRHGLRTLCRELLDTDISKQEQTSDWGKNNLSDEQIDYAANDVRYLHALQKKLNTLLAREGREEVAQNCFLHLPYRAWFDLKAGDDYDVFHYK